MWANGCCRCLHKWHQAVNSCGWKRALPLSVKSKGASPPYLMERANPELLKQARCRVERGVPEDCQLGWHGSCSSARHTSTARAWKEAIMRVTIHRCSVCPVIG